MKQIINRVFDEERALYESQDVEVISCRFDGPADGESALKESRQIVARECYFNLRYPFWHNDGLVISNCEMTEKCRAALWYSNEIAITQTKLHGTKALRECRNVKLDGCDIISPEFGWSVQGIAMKDCTAQSEYFMMRSANLSFANVSLQGKYSFQYITDSSFENCTFNTKDAFWHAKNVVVRNSVVHGEYLAWYCENVTFENCILSGTQPFCYCKQLKLVNCQMLEADLGFEKSDVDATLTSEVISIKNPYSGIIRVPAVGEMIMTDPRAQCKVVVGPPVVNE